MSNRMHTGLICLACQPDHLLNLQCVGIGRHVLTDRFNRRIGQLSSYTSPWQAWLVIHAGQWHAKPSTALDILVAITQDSSHTCLHGWRTDRRARGINRNRTAFNHTICTFVSLHAGCFDINHYALEGAGARQIVMMTRNVSTRLSYGRVEVYKVHMTYPYNSGLCCKGKQLSGACVYEIKHRYIHSGGNCHYTHI
jgi:hypothetical protein